MTTIRRIFPSQEMKCGTAVVLVGKAATVPYEKISGSMDVNASGLDTRLSKKFFNPGSGISGRIYYV